MAVSHRMRSTLTLYSAADCVHCHRVRLVLSAKGVAHDLVLVDPDQPSEDLIDLNPYQTLPTLVDRDLVLYEAGVVSEYLDERYPHPPLMPVDPLSRARLRLGMYRIATDWISMLDDRGGTARQQEAWRKRLRDSLTASAPLFKAARFFLNAELSLADCMLIPLLWRLPSLGIVLPKEAQPVRDYGERMFKNPGYQRSLTDAERSLEGG